TGIKTLHLPTRDRNAQTVDDLQRGVQFIQQEVEAGGKVYIHCRAGVGRGPTMMIAYLMTIGYTVQESLDLIKKVRVFIQPTRAQMKRLYEFENIVQPYKHTGSFDI